MLNFTIDYGELNCTVNGEHINSADAPPRFAFARVHALGTTRSAMIADLDAHLIANSRTGYHLESDSPPLLTLAYLKTLSPSVGDRAKPIDSIYGSAYGELVCRVKGEWSYEILGHKCTPPPHDGWTAYNLGGATIVPEITDPADDGARVMTMPTEDYNSFRGEWLPFPKLPTVAGQYCIFGILCTTWGTGTGTGIGGVAAGHFGQTNDLHMVIQNSKKSRWARHSSPTAWAGDDHAMQGGPASDIIFIRVDDDGVIDNVRRAYIQQADGSWMQLDDDVSRVLTLEADGLWWGSSQPIMDSGLPLKGRKLWLVSMEYGDIA